MSGGKLEVSIGADKSDFDKKIKEIEFDIKELSKVKLDKLKVGLDTTEINNQIKDAKNSLRSLQTTVKDTGSSFTGLTPKVANGGNALMQFSRIAQDAPYGIMGIGNNITSTAEAFSYLQKETGSTGGALKALGSSLLGSGGLLLGVSLLTTGLTLMAQSGLSVGDVIDKITGKFDAFGKELQKANEDAIKNSATEISGMKALVSAAENVSLSMHDRLIAVNELQKEYPGYFGNLSKEQILNGNIKTAVDGVTQALIAKAKAQAYTVELVKLSEEQFKLEEEKNKLLDEQTKLQKGLAEATKGATKGGGQAIQGLNLALSSTNSALKDNQKELDKNALAQEKWTSRINESVAASIKLKDEVIKPVKTFVTPQVSNISPLGIPAPLFDVAGIALFNGQVDAFGNKIKELPDIIKTTIDNIPSLIDEGAIRMTAALKNFNDLASGIITDGIANTFEGLGQSIGDALANGGNILDAVGSSLLSSLGTILTEMGKMAIQIGVGLLAIRFALQSLNPYAAIAAGVALIALGSFFSSKSKSIGGSIGGGASSSSGSGASNSSFTSSGFSSNQGGGTVVFEISGQKLIGVLSNTINSNKRLGGVIGL